MFYTSPGSRENEFRGLSLKTQFRMYALFLSAGLVLTLSACNKTPAANAAAPQAQAMPVQTVTVSSSPVPQSDEYVSTIKSRRSATISPRTTGNLTKILVHSGEFVKAGQVLMEIDPLTQVATVQSAQATERQKLAVYQYNQIEVERQRKLFDEGVTSRDARDQAEQSYANSKADYESSVASRKTQQEQLSYYKIAAPFDGIVGDVPVHIGDYVSQTTVLTTVDENKDLEAYIYIPTERATQVRRGLNVDIVDNEGNLIEHSAIDFISPQVDNGLQGILAKAPVRSAKVRTLQLVKARVIWTTTPKPVIPVLAVTRLGGQTFVYVAQGQDGKFIAKQRAVTLGDTLGNNYAVQDGLQNGDKVIVSGTQFLIDGVPVQPLG